MNEIEAQSMLEQELRRYRRLSYSKLFSLVNQSETIERAAPSGVTYQIEMQVFFDDASQRNLRVMGSIDSGGWRALKPTTNNFIMAPDGTFIDE